MDASFKDSGSGDREAEDDLLITNPGHLVVDEPPFDESCAEKSQHLKDCTVDPIADTTNESTVESSVKV